MRGVGAGAALLLALAAAWALGDPSPFVEAGEEFHRRNRQLLQHEESSDDVEVRDGGGQMEEEVRLRESKYSTEPSNGPELFYDEDKNFLMEVKKGIIVHFYEASTGSSNLVAKARLDKPAASIKGSMTTKTDFLMNLEWKGNPIESYFGNLRLDSIMIKMIFNRSFSEWKLLDLEISKAVVAGANILDSGMQGDEKSGQELKVKSSYGYKVTAPLGLTFCCDDTGVFKPSSGAPGNRYKLGLSLPGLKLMVFDVPNTKFGPEWYCGEMLSVGLLVGIIISLFFAIVCCYGFSMLASINTMDRFDDPKGKPIHVPQTE